MILVGSNFLRNAIQLTKSIVIIGGKFLILEGTCSASGISDLCSATTDSIYARINSVEFPDVSQSHFSLTK